MKISRVIDVDYAIHESTNNENFFNFGSHLYIVDGYLRVGFNDLSSYVDIYEEFDLQINEIEVFSIVKK